MLLNKEIVGLKSRKTVSVDTDVEVVIRPVPLEAMMRIMKEYNIGKLVKNGKEPTPDEVESLVKSGDINFGMIKDIVLLSVVQPKLSNGPSDTDIDVNDISQYHLKIFQAAMEFSGMGENNEAQSFRGDGSGAASSDGGGGVRSTSKRDSGATGQPQLATAV